MGFINEKDNPGTNLYAIHIEKESRQKSGDGNVVAEAKLFKQHRKICNTI